MDCLDCRHCKVTVSKGILRCKAGHWLKNDGTEKVIILRIKEFKTLHFEWRNTFNAGSRCCSMISME